MERISSRHFGSRIEERARNWLLEQNPARRVLCRNYLWKGGELDLVLEEPARGGKLELVFVEVRARLPGSWASGIESISYPKQLRLRRTIDRFLARYSGGAMSVRFDVLSWDGRRWQYHPNIWLP